jgi:hypothetical protein
MAHFHLASNGTTGVEIVPATAGKRVRFLSFGCSTVGNQGTLALTIYDGTAAAGTARANFRLGEFSDLGSLHHYFKTTVSGASVFPKSWFTAGKSVEFALSSGASTSYIVFGEYVVEG